MVQRTGVRGINRYGRTSQGVRVMNLREGDVVSAVALVVESEAATAAPAAELGEGLDGGLAAEDLAVEDDVLEPVEDLDEVTLETEDDEDDEV
jgi:DNA gyrase subunit A